MLSIKDYEAQFGIEEIDKLIFQAQYPKIPISFRLRYLYFAYSKVLDNIKKYHFTAKQIKQHLVKSHYDNFEISFNKKSIEFVQEMDETFIKYFTKEFNSHELEFILYPQKKQNYDFSSQYFNHIENLKITSCRYDDFKFVRKLKSGKLYFLITFKDKKNFLLVSFPAQQKKYILVKNNSKLILLNLRIILESYLQVFFPLRQINEVLEFRLHENFLHQVMRFNYKDEIKMVNKFSCIEANKVSDTYLLEHITQSLNLREENIILTKKALFLDDLIEVLSQHTDIFSTNKTSLENNLLPISIQNHKDVLQDRFYHHPYQDYHEIMCFFHQVAIDPNVTKIQLTLYHIEKNSRIVEALILAAQNHKKVEVYVEVNVDDDLKPVYQYIKLLQKNNIKVFYNPNGPVVHAKMCLVTFKKSSLYKSVSLLSTGNFNEKNAASYCDFSLITYHSGINSDLKKIFDFILHQKKLPRLNHLFLSAHNLRQNLNMLLKYSRKAIKNGHQVEIFLKTKHITDSEIVKRISKLNCPIGIQIRNASEIAYKENIKQYSFIGNYLEHHRVYYFKIKNKEFLYLGSASLSAKNLDHRYELIFPIYNQTIIEQVKEDIITNIQQRNHACWLMTPKGYRFMFDTKQVDIQTFLTHKYASR